MRTRKLVRPSLQLRLCLWFLGVVAVGLILQFALITSRLSDVFVGLPGERGSQFEEIASTVRESALLSLLVVPPVTLLIAVFASFRFAGPVLRFKDFLERVKRGENPPDCRLRRGDELQDVCQLLNQVTAPLRGRGAAARGDAEDRAA